MSGGDAVESALVEPAVASEPVTSAWVVPVVDVPVVGAESSPQPRNNPNTGTQSASRRMLHDPQIDHGNAS